ncbi:MAG: hypothetical protein M3N50_14230 [Pseudomonadota bacterium]|nr:hypothetical protein [Pseudomonadota bacterium]
MGNGRVEMLIRDDGDAQALRHWEAARQLMECGQPIMVCKTALLEFDWVIRGYYGLPVREIAKTMNHHAPRVTLG